MFDELLRIGESLRPWLIGLSALSIGSLLLMAALGARLIAQLPADYFVSTRPRARAHPLAWLLRNLIGLVLLLAGIAMLVLPGQGLLTILAALLLMDFPGKMRLERRLLEVPQVRRSVDWLRERAGAPPLELDQALGAGEDGQY